MSWFVREKNLRENTVKRTLGEGIFRKCDECNVTLKAEEFTNNAEVCPNCNHHYPLSGEAWMDLLLDPGSWEEHDVDLVAEDPLEFKDAKRYTDRLAESRKKTGLNDAFMSGSGKIGGRDLQIGTFQFRFMGGSMGAVVGEKVTRVFERAAANKQPAIVLTSSGGARMQEGILSLMQMAKTVAALGRLRDTKMPFVSVLLHPTTGGVAASFAMLGDINIAEPKALIGFAGPRVIETTIRQTLPEGFQRSEYLLDHGMLDIIADRHTMRATIGKLLGHFLD